MEPLELEQRLATEIRPRLFFTAFTRHWWTLVSGGASIPSTIAALWASAWWAKILWGIAALTCACFASYWVWRDQREAYVREATRNALPELRLTIRKVHVRTPVISRLTSQLVDSIGRQFDRPDLVNAPPAFDIYVQFHMTNRTQVSTTIQQYQLFVGPNRVIGSPFQNLKGQTLLIDYEVWDQNGAHRAVRQPELLLEDFAGQLNKVSVEYSQGKLGWLRFGCSGVSPSDVSLRDIELIAIDALGFAHTAMMEKNAEITKEEPGI